MAVDGTVLDVPDSIANARCNKPHFAFLLRFVDALRSGGGCERKTAASSHTRDAADVGASYIPILGCKQH